MTIPKFAQNILKQKQDANVWYPNDNIYYTSIDVITINKNIVPTESAFLLEKYDIIPNIILPKYTRSFNRKIPLSISTINFDFSNYNTEEIEKILDELYISLSDFLLYIKLNNIIEAESEYYMYNTAFELLLLQKEIPQQIKIYFPDPIIMYNILHKINNTNDLIELLNKIKYKIEINKK